MLSSKKRLRRAIFGARPTGRASFAYGTVAYYPGPPGVAVVVSKKVAKTAPRRNRMRRRVYSALRTAPITRAIIVYPNAKILDTPFTDLVSSLSDVASAR